MTECTQIQWAARTAAWLGEGGAILGAPRHNVLGTTALTPPVLATGGPAMTNEVEAEAPEPVDIRQVMDEMEAFRAAQDEARQRYVEASMKTVVDLSERGQDEQAFAILRSLFRPEPFWERWIGPTYGRLT